MITYHMDNTLKAMKENATWKLYNNGNLVGQFAYFADLQTRAMEIYKVPATAA